MFCSSCGSHFSSQDKFCGKCGSKVGGTPSQAHKEMAATSEPGPHNPQSSASQQASAQLQNLKESEFVKQGQAVGKAYFSFALTAFKSPFTFARNMSEASIVNGLISIILFALIVPMTSWWASRNAYFSVPFFETVVIPAVVLTLGVLLMVGVMNGVLKLMQVDADFKMVVSRFGALLVFPVAIGLVGFIFALLSAKAFGSLIAFVSLMFFPLTFLGTMFSFDKKRPGGLDAFYGIILTNVLITIIALILMLIVADAVISNLIPSGIGLPF